MTSHARLVKLAGDIVLQADVALADTELLRRYTAARDEAAFAELVRRNGPLVLRACQHILGESTADDAFQAVFLLLARSASRLTRPGSLAGWLHAAAVRIAKKARRGEERRRRREAACRIPPITSDDLTWREVREVLDAEIAALPECYRLPVVLCYVQELSHEEAARRGGLTVGELRGRLDRGRERLRKRLARYGLPVVTPVLVLGCPPPVSASLVESATKSASAGTLGGVVPQAVAVLLRPTGRVRFTLLLAPAMAAMAAIGAILGAASGPSGDSTTAEPPHPRTPIITAADALTPTDVFGDPLPPGAVARLGSARFQHGGNVSGIIMAPDGKLVLSQGRQENRLWEGETGRPVPLWGGLTKAVNPFTFTTFGSTLAAVVWEKDKERIRLVNPVTGEEIRLLPWAAADSSCVAPDGKTVVTIRGENRAPGQFRFILSVWNNETKSWRDLFEDVGPPPIHPFQFSADSKILAFHGNDAAVRVWDVAGAKLLLQLLGNNQRDEAVALSPNGKLLAKEDRAAKKVRVWEVSTGKELPELPPYQPKPNGVGELAFSSDGKTLAGIDDRSTIRLWDVVARKKVRDIQANTSRIEQLVFTGDGKRLYVADGNGVSVWDPQTGKPLDDYGGHRYAISGVAWSLDGKWVTSGAGYADNVGRVWDSVTGRKVLDLIGHQIGIECVAYSPDGSLLATGSQDGTARLWNAATGKELHSFEAKDRMVYALAFSPDGQFLVTGGEKALHVWDVAGRKEARTILHPADLTLQILFIRGGQRMLVRDYKAGTRVIDFATGRDEVRLVVGGRRSSAAAVSLDGQLIALADDEGIIRLADAFTGREIRLLAVPVTKELDARDVMGLDFSPDGRTLAVAYSLGEVHVYEVATGSDRFRFLGHVDAALGVKFSPDGTRLCSFADDHTLLIWDVTGTRLASAPPPKNVDTAWADLESPDAGKGFAAIRYLAGDPTSAVRLVAEGVKPVAFVDAKVVAALIQKLGSPEFQDREGASKELAVFAPAVVDQLREAAGKSESPEVRTRLQTILARVDVTKLTGERLRAARAVEVLERIGSAEARKVLSGLVAGAPGAELTRNAAASIARMGGTK